MDRGRVGEDRGSKETDGCPLTVVNYRDIDEKRRLPRGGQSGIDVVGYVWRPWGIHIDIVRDRGSKGMDRCPLTQPTTIQTHRPLHP
jgi:hypothetical protein